MIKILFVCLGNICRSPMAEGVAEHAIRGRGLSSKVFVDSAGTSGFHGGEQADVRTRDLLERHGIELNSRSRQVKTDDFEAFDYILAMDSSNLANLRRICPPRYAHKLELVLEPVGGGDVPDPYYGGVDGFEHNYQQLTAAIDAWLDRIV